MNNYGCSLVWVIRSADGTRSIIELIEELALRGGGFGLFTAARRRHRDGRRHRGRRPIRQRAGASTAEDDACTGWAL